MRKIKVKENNDFFNSDDESSFDVLSDLAGHVKSEQGIIKPRRMKRIQGTGGPHEESKHMQGGSASSDESDEEMD